MRDGNIGTRGEKATSHASLYMYATKLFRISSDVARRCRKSAGFTWVGGGATFHRRILSISMCSGGGACLGPQVTEACMIASRPKLQFLHLFLIILMSSFRN